MKTMKTMKTDEAAKVLKTSPYQVRELLKRGEVPGAKFGRHWRVDAVALQAKLNGGPERYAVKVRGVKAKT